MRKTTRKKLDHQEVLSFYDTCRNYRMTAKHFGVAHNAIQYIVEKYYGKSSKIHGGKAKPGVDLADGVVSSSFDTFVITCAMNDTKTNQQVFGARTEERGGKVREFAGKVVGTCAKGTRKLVYVRGEERGAATSPARPATPRATSRTKDEDIITECRDGSIVRGNAGCKS
jgi:hypothetical protein